MKKRILIVEDDESVARMLRDNLEYEGFIVDCATDGRHALRQVRQSAPDLVLLDVILPGLDGFSVCRALSSEPKRTPIIILTARTGKEDTVQGLELGADDYVTKPFALEELLARVHAVLRRSHPSLKLLAIGDVVIDFERKTVQKSGRPLTLTFREFEVLRYLAERAGRIVSRDELLCHVWGYSDAPLSRTVDNLVARLRRKIEPDPHHPRYVRTAHGDGYPLTLDA